MSSCLPAECPNHRATDLGFLLYFFLSSGPHECQFPGKVVAPSPMQPRGSSFQLAKPGL